MHDPLIEAELSYRPSQVKVIKPGNYVRCAVTGLTILLEDLRYRSVERQEAYANGAAALEAEEAARRAKPA